MDFEVLAKCFNSLELTSSRLEMTNILAELLKKASQEEIRKIIYLLQCRVASPFEGIELGVGEKFVEESIALATGFSKKEVESEYKSLGDLGLVAEKLVSKKKQKSFFFEKLTVEHVFNNFYKIATRTGERSQELKIRLLAELFNNASPLEARYLARIPTGNLRLGIGDPTVLDAISVMAAGHKKLREKLEDAYNICPDLGLIAEIFWKGGLEALENISISPGIPIRPALAERLPSAEEIFKKLGRCAAEAKYDGVRLQVHKLSDKVKIFSRRLEDLTNMFPEIVEETKKLPYEQIVFEGEALTYNEQTGEYYSFQITMQRKRKYDIEKITEKLPLNLFVFDVLYLDGKNLLKKPYLERRKILEKMLAHSKGILKISEMKIVNSVEELEATFNDYVTRGLEGLIAKDLSAPYIAGARKFAWIKLKRSYKGELQDTIDVVILGYYFGRGARVEFGLGGLLTGVYDDKKDEFVTIAKVGSGFTEDQMRELKEMLDKIKVSKKPSRVNSILAPDVWVEPKYVITLAADEISKSPLHTCAREKETGLALRFPRMISHRFDKNPEDSTTVQEILEMYKKQKRVELEKN